LSQNEIQDVLYALDKHDSNRIRYMDFVHMLENAGSDGTDGPTDVGVDDVLDRLRELIRNAARKGVDPQESFEHFDTTGSARFDERQFYEGLGKLGFKVTRQQVQRLMDKLDARDGYVRYADFLRVLAPGGSHGDDADDAELFGRIRRIIRNRGAGEVSRVFREFDYDRSGYLDRREFSEALIKIQVHLTEPEARRLLNKMDRNGDGRISYGEFLDFVQGRPSTSQTPHRGALKVAELLGSLSHRLQRDARRLGKGDIKRVFRGLDRDDTGVLSKRHFQRGLETLDFDLGLRLSQNEIQDVLYALDKHDSNRIRYMDFVHMLTS